MISIALDPTKHLFSFTSSLDGAKPFPLPLTGEPFPINPDTGYPYPEDCSKFGWGTYYFSDAAAKAFQNLYKNVDGLLDEWADFWGHTARYFRDYPSVIGYELINEPFCGDVFTYVLHYIDDTQFCG